MRLKTAMKIIEESNKEGYRVSMEKLSGGILRSDHFPDTSEEPFATDAVAWARAREFALATKGDYYNIYVVDRRFVPVDGYKEKMLNPRNPGGAE